MHQHPMAGTATALAAALAADVAEALARRDPVRLAGGLTETVRLRALLPGAAIAAHGRADVAGCMYGWFADFDTVTVLGSAGEAVADRLLLHYRLGLGQRDTRWVCTQTAVCKVTEGRLAVIDLLCSGFRETSDHDDSDHSHLPGPPEGAGLLG